MLNIYIANLGKYNEGKLVGKWVELPCYNLKEVLKQIGVIEGTTYEEYAIHDYESDIEGVEISEYADIYELNELAEQLDALTAYEKEHLSAYIEAHCANLAYALEHFENTSFYPDMTMQEVAEALINDGCFGDIPASIANYIDYEAIARDLRCEDYTEVSNGVISFD